MAQFTSDDVEFRARLATICDAEFVRVEALFSANAQPLTGLR
ncbi:hypothetical protein [Muricoccus radiodurans]